MAIFLGRLRHSAGHREPSELWKICRRLLFVEVEGAWHDMHHIRLSGSEPHFADEHIGHDERVNSLHRERMRPAGIFGTPRGLCSGSERKSWNGVENMDASAIWRVRFYRRKSLGRNAIPASSGR